MNNFWIWMACVVDDVLIVVFSWSDNTFIYEGYIWLVITVINIEWTLDTLRVL